MIVERIVAYALPGLIFDNLKDLWGIVLLISGFGGIGRFALMCLRLSKKKPEANHKEETLWQKVMLWQAHLSQARLF